MKAGGIVAVFLISSTFASTSGYGQSASMEESVLLNAVTTSGSITLTAPEFSGTTAYSIYRKLRSDADFPGSPLATIPITSPTDMYYEDTGISPYILYEYKVIRSASAGTGYGYICTGFKVPASAWSGDADHYMGKVIVLTENGLATLIGPELAQLTSDLKADGWVPIIDNSVSSADNPDDVRDLIIDKYTDDPTHTKAVLLIGRIPVPLTQNDDIDPDGHNITDRLWPVDGYYGEMNDTWTKHSSGPYNGAFNMNSFPSDIELAVGRVDLSDLPAFSLSEAQLTSAYLQRVHDFRTADLVPTNRAIIFDSFEGYPISSGAWISFPPIVGGNPVYTTGPEGALSLAGLYRAPAWYGAFEFYHFVDLEDITAIGEGIENGGSYLWTYSAGSGLTNGTGAGRVGTTDLLASEGYEFGGAFNLTAGSYMGRWQTTDNYLRAVLATGHALTNAWSVSPHWYFHNMGMGEPMGRSIQQSMNNVHTRYAPHGAWVSGTSPNIHMALFGDPTLRMRMLAPPSELIVSNESGDAHLEWTQSPVKGVYGYYLYVFDEDGVPTLLNPFPVTGTSYTTSIPYVGCMEFMVRATKLITTHSGSYWNLSLGAIGGVLCPLSVKVFLGGPYNSGSGLMNDALRTLAAFPLTEPYTALDADMDPVGGGGGETTDSGVLAGTGANAIVDWVLVELRSRYDPSIVVEARCGLVQRDGDVVSPLDGTSDLEFNSYGVFHVAVRHRNHLGVMTDYKITLSSGAPAAVDFTDPGTDTYGTDAQKNVSGTMVLWPGNVWTNDHTVKYSGANNDKDPILIGIGGVNPNNTVPNVYALEDVNMDNTIKYIGTNNDRDIILVTIGGINPNAMRVEQLP